MLSLSKLLFVALALLAPAEAQVYRCDFDPSRSSIDFTLGATLHTVHGSFPFKRGSVTFDRATGKMTGELVADAASGASGDNGRDRRMHKEILESARYPEIVFQPQSAEGPFSGHDVSRLTVTGTFLLHGAGHELKIPLEIDPAQGTLQAQFSVPYVMWGIKDPSTFMLRVKNEVEIRIRAAIRLSSDK